MDLEPNLPKNDLLNEVDHLPHSKIDSILGDVKGKVYLFIIFTKNNVLVAESPKTPATVVITSKDITISTVKHNSVPDGRMNEVQEKIARHQMDVISFASLGLYKGLKQINPKILGFLLGFIKKS